MRYVFSFLVIAFSISALLGGFFGGRAAVPHFPAATPLPQGTLSPQLPRAGAPLDELAHDQFAGDAAVVLADSGAEVRGDARLALVIVDAGRSLALESPFLSLNVPVTIVIDPSGSAASSIAQLAVQQKDAVYVQLPDETVSADELRALRGRFPGMSGVAMRLTRPPDPGELSAIRTARLAFFDEYGEEDGAAARFASAGVRYAARSVTIDDHAQRSYVAYMLRQAAHLARGRAGIVMGRPFPGTFQAFQDLIAQASRDGIRIIGLP